MKKRLTLIFLLGLLLLAMPSIFAFAGFNNQNGDNGKSAERGTGKDNNMDGCNVPKNAKSAWVYIPPEDVVWLGGKCCASNIEVFEGIYLPNQCCNPPDFIPGPGVPGNHCRCFENRGFTEL